MTAKHKRAAGTGDIPTPSALDQLLAAEVDIAAQEAAAAEQARVLLDGVRSIIDAIERDGAVALERELETLDGAARIQQSAAIAEIDADASRRAARYRALSPADVARSATRIAEQLTRIAEGNSP